MKKQLSPAVVVGVLLAAVLVIGAVIWSATTIRPTVTYTVGGGEMTPVGGPPPAASSSKPAAPAGAPGK